LCLSRAICSDEAKDRIGRHQDEQYAKEEHSSADGPIDRRPVCRRNDLRRSVPRCIWKRAALEIAVSELREDNAEDEKKRCCDGVRE